MQILFNIFPAFNSLHCKVGPVQYREYEYGLLSYSLYSYPVDSAIHGERRGLHHLYRQAVE